MGALKEDEIGAGFLIGGETLRLSLEMQYLQSGPQRGAELKRLEFANGGPQSWA